MTLAQAIKAAKVIWLDHCDITLRINKKQAAEIRRKYGPFISDWDGGPESHWSLDECRLYITVAQS